MKGIRKTQKEGDAMRNRKENSLYTDRKPFIKNFLENGELQLFRKLKKRPNTEVLLESQKNQTAWKFQNLHENQQLERGKPLEKVGFKSRLIVTVLMTAIIFCLTWAVSGSVQYFFAKRSYDNLMSHAVYVYENPELSGIYYYAGQQAYSQYGTTHHEYFPLNEDGTRMGTAGYENILDVPLPSWYRKLASSQGFEEIGRGPSRSFPQKPSLISYITFGGGFVNGLNRFWISALVSAVCGLFFYAAMRRSQQVQNSLFDTTDINQHYDDAHIALPHEIFENFEPFPDAGAHSDVQFTTLISHAALSSKGLPFVELTARAEEDIYDEDGDIAYFKGEELIDEDGRLITKSVPMIDEQFSKKLFESVGVSRDQQRVFDASKIAYNPGNTKRGRKDRCETLADFIAKDWTLPPYETQRPGGCYLVDTAPANTLLIAITRAGKGQRYIEPVIDMKTRENIKSNLIINDPKGELTLKNYVKATKRGYQPVQFNLINSMNTDIYQPLLLAAQSARSGEMAKCANYVKNIAEVFFPASKGGEDQMWNNAASNAFQRAAYGLIDYYLEKEKSLRRQAVRENWSSSTLENRIDENWGKVTLYNCYVFFTQLASKKLINPWVKFKEEDSLGAYDTMKQLDPQQYQSRRTAAKEQAKLWGTSKEMDMLSLYFNAVTMLPNNRIRQLVQDADRSLRLIADAEKMLASIYGVAITSMAFFTDPTISALTSGTPKQSIDLSGISFPRKIAIRFSSVFMRDNKWMGFHIQWKAFEDGTFKKPLGEKFEHSSVITREGWAEYVFEGIFLEDKAYLQLDIIDPGTGFNVRSFYFQFEKSYSTSLGGRRYLKDPVLDEKIINGGILTEIVKVRTRSKKDPSKFRSVYKIGRSFFRTKKIINIESDHPMVSEVQEPVIMQDMVRYSEKPKIIFLITPPHLAKYTKLVLIFLHQVIDLNFDQSYMTKKNQKPLVKTFVMLDEAGNLQSEGHGIENFETMLSIGLGQDQQFTVVLQTLAQLTAVYGDSSDKTLQGNAANTIFLRSTDDQMLQRLEKMSGMTHQSYIDDKSVVVDKSKIWMQNRNEVTYSKKTVQEPLISYTNLNSLTMGDSIVFRAGENPIWNRNEMAIPMAWQLFENDIRIPGTEYTLQTLPSVSTAKDFDVNQNIPDFEEIFREIQAKAIMAQECREILKAAYGYDENDLSHMDPDFVADEIMEIIDARISSVRGAEITAATGEYILKNASVNEELLERQKFYQQKEDQLDLKRYAGNRISRADLVGHGGKPNHSLDRNIMETYADLKAAFCSDPAWFTVTKDGLYDVTGTVLYIRHLDASQAAGRINEAIENPDLRVYGDEKISAGHIAHYEVTDAFYRFLASLEDWNGFVSGRFEIEMSRKVKNDCAM